MLVMAFERGRQTSSDREGSVEMRQRIVVRKLIVTALAVSFVIVSCSKNQQLSKKDLKIVAGDLRTLALASARMTELLARGDITQIFYRNQSELLLKKVVAIPKQLKGSGEQPDQEADRRKLTDVAARLQAELEKTQRGELLTSQELNQLGSEAKAIEDALKEK
jgi:hypothetical protein